MIASVQRIQTVSVLLAIALVSVCFAQIDSERGVTTPEDGEAVREVDQHLPDVLSINEDARWPQDFVFRITEHERSPDGQRRVVARGKYGDGVVGLEVVLSNEWEFSDLALEGGGALQLAWSTLELRSIGPESDSLLRALADVYGRPAPDGPFVGAFLCDAVYLGDDPASIDEQAVRIKIFTGQGDEPDYAEVFVNIDLAAFRLEIAEKDEEYRAPLVRSLTGDGEE